MSPRKPGSLKPYTTGEIARELDVSINTVIAWLERGEMPWHWSDQENQRGRRLVKVKDFNAWKRRQTG